METQNIENEVVLYQIDNLQKIEVVVKNDTVWLTQAQMAQLFGVQKAAISKHLKNIFASGELIQNSVVSVLETTAKDGKIYAINFYSLDVILSLGYRINSIYATRFRIWANRVLKEYILRGAAVNQRIDCMENRLLKNEHHLLTVEQKLDDFLHAALPPKQGVFFEGQIFDAYQFVADLVRSAKSSIVLIDNYVNDSVLTLLDKRAANVTATIGVNKITPGLQLDLQRHNAQYPPIAVRELAAIHDRFLLIDGQRLYTFGASFKDLGKKLFCFSLLESEELVRAVGAMLQG
ncbi:MAG: virulence RhuM family protein [Bacteroidales bacterium]|nr:virulence RhuM family protein [Bacteroidales bacterium]